MILFKKINNKISYRSIHNQSYINLEKKYNKLLNDNNIYKNKIAILNKNILNLTCINNKLQENNKLLLEEYNNKLKFYNLNFFKFFNK